MPGQLQRLRMAAKIVSYIVCLILYSVLFYRISLFPPCKMGMILNSNIKQAREISNKYLLCEQITSRP